MLASARRQHDRQVRLSGRALVAARGAWRLLDRHALAATASRFVARLLPALAAAQLDAAALATAYLQAAFGEQNLGLEPAGEVNPRAFAGVASDGRPLETLLTVPLETVRRLSEQGMPVSRAMQVGRQQLDRIVTTQVADAARVATGVGVAATPRAGYVRLLNPPACSRCIVLVDRVYEWNAGFLRHPQCQCIHVPTTKASGEWMATSARKYFEGLSEAEQDRIFGKAGAQAIRDGASVGQVVNARRGMRTAALYGRELQITSEGTTRRGLAGRRLIESGARVTRERAELVTRQTRTGPELRRVSRERVQIPRLMPEQIYRDATSRDDAIRLLRRFGYIT